MQNDQQPTQPATPAVDSGAEAAWQFTGDPSGGDTQQPEAQPDLSVSWTASEFIAHDKSAGWYLLLVLATLVASAIAFLLTRRDILTTVIILIAGGLFGVIAARQPRELPYKIDSSGLQVGEKHFSYADFKSFSVVQEESVESIWLLPLQRYTPGLSIYFSPEDKEQILAVLDDYLPVEQRKLDFVDRLMHKIRF